MIVEKEIDVYYYPKKGGLSSWDICAGEALVKGMGGATQLITQSNFMDLLES